MIKSCLSAERIFSHMYNLDIIAGGRPGNDREITPNDMKISQSSILGRHRKPAPMSMMVIIYHEGVFTLSIRRIQIIKTNIN